MRMIGFTLFALIYRRNYPAFWNGMGAMAEQIEDPGIVPRGIVEGLLSLTWTATLLLAIAGTQALPTHQAALAIPAQAAILALVTAVLMTVGKPMSNGQVNPVLTAAYAFDRRLPSSWIYSIAQIAGAIIAIQLFERLLGNPVMAAWVTSSLTYERYAGEWLGAAAFIMVLLWTRRSVPAKAALLAGAVLGIAYWASNGAVLINPAFTFAIAYATMETNPVIIDALPSILLAQFGGAIMGLFVGRFIWRRGS